MAFSERKCVKTAAKSCPFGKLTTFLDTARRGECENRPPVAQNGPETAEKRDFRFEAKS